METGNLTMFDAKIPCEVHDPHLKYPVLLTYMDLSGVNLKAYQEHWNDMHHGKRLKVILQERNAQRKFLANSSLSV
jgi:hypothetical protein